MKGHTIREGVRIRTINIAKNTLTMEEGFHLNFPKYIICYVKFKADKMVRMILKEDSLRGETRSRGWCNSGSRRRNRCSVKGYDGCATKMNFKNGRIDKNDELVLLYYVLCLFFMYTIAIDKYIKLQSVIETR